MISYAFMLILGIFFAGYLDIQSNIPVFLVISVVFGLVVYLNSKIKKVTQRIIFSVIGIIIFIAGGIYSHCYRENLFKKAQEFISSAGEEIIVTVTDDINASDSSSLLIAKAKDDIFISVRCYTKDEFFPGDILILKKPNIRLLNKDNYITSKYRRMLGKNTIISTACYEYQITKKGIDNTYAKTRYFYNLRKNTFYSLVKYLGFSEAAFAYSVVSSDKSYIPNELYQKLIKSGLIHMSSVSGFHFVFLCGILMGVSVFFSAYHRRRLIIVIICATLFMFYTGAGPAVLRAYFMFVGTVIGDLFYSRRFKSSTSLVLVTTAMMLFNPLCIFDNSFLLSFASTYGIIFLNNDIKSLFKATKLFSKDILALNMSVTIFILPVVFSIFGRINIFSLFSNVLVGFIAGTMMLLTFLLWCSDMFFKPMCLIVVPVLRLIIKYIFLVIEFISKIEIFKITGAFSVMCAAFLTGTVYFLVKYIKNIKNKRKLISVIVMIFGFFVSCFLQYADNKAYITFISGGDTSCVDIIYKSKHIVASDINNFIYNMNNSSLRQNEKIELFIITNSDIENADAACRAFENYKIENIVATQNVLQKLKNDDRIKSNLLTFRDFSINGFDISFNYNKNYNLLISFDFIFKGEHFIITDNLYYVFENRDKLFDCTVLFSGNEKTIRKLEAIDLDKSVKIVNNSDLPMITVK